MASLLLWTRDKLKSIQLEYIRGKLVSELTTCSSTNYVNCNGRPNHICTIFNYKQKEKYVNLQNQCLLIIKSRYSYP